MNVLRRFATSWLLIMFVAIESVTPVRSATPPSREVRQSQLSFYTINLIYVANTATNSISVYTSQQYGNARPVAKIEGPDTKLDGPIGLTFDSLGYLYVVNRGESSSVTVYAPHARGDAKPIRVLVGPKTRLRNIMSPADYPVGSIAVDLAHDRLFVGRASPDQTVPFNHTVLIFSAHANGDEKPLGSIGASDLPIDPTAINPGLYGQNFAPAVVLDAYRNQLIVSSEGYYCCHGDDGWMYYRPSDLSTLAAFGFYANNTLVGPAVSPHNARLVSTGDDTLEVWSRDVTGSAGNPNLPGNVLPLKVFVNPFAAAYTAVTVDTDDTIWALSGSNVLEGYEAGHASPRVITGLIGATAIATIPMTAP